LKKLRLGPNRRFEQKLRRPVKLYESRTGLRLFQINTHQTAFFRNPERMQRVQAFTRLTSPDFPSTHRIFWRLGYQVFVLLLFA
jgi:hypothetical protein